MTREYTELIAKALKDVRDYQANPKCRGVVTEVARVLGSRLHDADPSFDFEEFMKAVWG